MRTVAAALYWIVAITITLGAYGHGFLGIKPVEAAIAATTLSPDILRVIWIVWYDVSGSMLTFGVLLFWAWPSVKTGSSSRSGVPLIIGAFYAATGIGAYLYSGREPFWLLFVTQGVILIGTTLLLLRPPPADSRRPGTFEARTP
jgi:hypothetical protein